MCLKYKMITDKKNGRKKNDLHSVWNSSILLRWKKSAVHISWWCSFVLKYLRIVQHNWTSSTGKSDYLIKTKWEKNSAKHDRGSNVYCLIWKLYLNMFMHIVVNSTAIIVRKRGRLAKIFHRQFTLWTNIAKKNPLLVDCLHFSEAAYIQAEST